MSIEVKKEIEDIVVFISEIFKVLWEEGVCKVCGIDKDDDSVFLCDICDVEYYIYCLNFFFVRILEGNWYCSSCVFGVSMLEFISKGV